MQLTSSHTLKTFTIDHDSWKANAQDIMGAAFYMGAKRSEASRTYTAEQHRQARKDSAMFSPAATIPCLHWPRFIQARIGLTSHLLTHFTNQTPPPWRWDGGHRRHGRTNDIITARFTTVAYICVSSLANILNVSDNSFYFISNKSDNFIEMIGPKNEPSGEVIMSINLIMFTFKSRSMDHNYGNLEK